VSVDRVKGAFETIVVRVAESALVELVPKQRNMLSDFLTLLSKWNDRVNLVSRKDFEGVVKDRLFDALVLWREFGPWTGPGDTNSYYVAGRKPDPHGAQVPACKFSVDRGRPPGIGPCGDTARAAGTPSRGYRNAWDV